MAAEKEIANCVLASLDPVVEFREVSKWYGPVIGVNRFSLRIEPGITGLLGPNGAGKSTLLQLATGQLKPSMGEVFVLGRRVWNNAGLNRHIGLCPEQDALYDWMTGLDFVRTSAGLSGLGRKAAQIAAVRTMAMVGMTEHMNRAIQGYSRGMRQRTKMAQALVHEPTILFLDEPLTGTDPVARREVIDIIRRLGREGKSVVVSSHVLHEVQAVTSNIVLINRGRLLATGHVRDIRDLIDRHPHRIVLASNDNRRLASHLAALEGVAGVKFLDDRSRILVETRAPASFYARLPDLAREEGLLIHEVYSEDDNLEAVFKYLVKT